MNTAETRILRLAQERRATLDEMGKPLGLKLAGKKYLSKKQCAERIVSEELRRATSQASPTPTPGASQVTSGRPANPAFEHKATQGPTSPQAKDKRGGARPGAGRKPGQTADVCRAQSMPQIPNPAVKQFVQMAFESWAVSVGESKIALTEAEASDLALPYTQLLHYAGYGSDKLPPWLVPALAATWTTWNMVKSRVHMTAKVKPEMFSGKGIVGRLVGLPTKKNVVEHDAEMAGRQGGR